MSNHVRAARRAIALAVLLGASVATAGAQTPAKPSAPAAAAKPAATAPSGPAAAFAGTWEMVPARSDFGPAAAQAPSKITLTVEPSETKVRFTQAMTGAAGSRSQSKEYALDGTPTREDAPGGITATSTAKMDGAAFLVQTQLSVGEQEATQTSRWTLAPDGKELTVDQQIATAMGPMVMKIVFVRQ